MTCITNNDVILLCLVFLNYFKKMNIKEKTIYSKKYLYKKIRIKRKLIEFPKEMLEEMYVHIFFHCQSKYLENFSNPSYSEIFIQRLLNTFC